MKATLLIGRVLLVLVGSFQGLFAHVNFAKGLDELIKGPQVELLCSEPRSQSHACPDLVEKYISLRARLWDFYKNPTKYGFKEYQLVSGEDGKFTNHIQKQLYELGNECLKAQVNHCYPSLKQNIERINLNTIFEEFKSNHHYRMGDPAVFCYLRAKKLAFELAQKGFSSEIVRINQAPVLIAPLLDANDSYLGRYIDYSGNHYVLMVKDENGNEIILDPQFSEKPQQKEEYFKSTIGTVCEESEDVRNIWGCNYSRSNFYNEIEHGEKFRPEQSEVQYKNNGDFIEKILNGKELTECGYVSPGDGYFDPQNKPKISAGSEEITNKTRGFLIVSNLQNLYLDRLKYLDDPVYELENKKRFRDYDNQVQIFKTHILKVCNNFNFSKDECDKIRIDYQEYLKSKI
jgi:hypothetical protein